MNMNMNMEELDMDGHMEAVGLLYFYNFFFSFFSLVFLAGPLISLS